MELFMDTLIGRTIFVIGATLALLAVAIGFTAALVAV